MTIAVHSAEKSPFATEMRHYATRSETGFAICSIQHKATIYSWTSLHPPAFDFFIIIPVTAANGKWIS